MLRMSTRCCCNGISAAILLIVALAVARSAAFSAAWRSRAASLARCSRTWSISSWRSFATSAGSASVGGWKSATGSAASVSAACSLATSSWVATRSLCRCSCSARSIVGSSSINRSPAWTCSPSVTWIALITPVSKGWMTLLRPLGTILPCAAAMMSIVPHDAQAIAKQKTLMMTRAIARPTGEVESRRAPAPPAGMPIRDCVGERPVAGMGRRDWWISSRLNDGSDRRQATLQPVQRRIPPAGTDQLVMGAVFDDATRLERNDAVDKTYGR